MVVLLLPQSCRSFVVVVVLCFFDVSCFLSINICPSMFLLVASQKKENSFMHIYEGTFFNVLFFS
jgi:hypothetical protein